MVIKRKIQEDLTILNIYALKRSTFYFIKDILVQLKSHIDPKTVIVDGFAIQLLPRHRSSKQNLSREMGELNNIINPMYQIDIDRTFH